MGNQLSHALADAGLVSQEKVEKQLAQETKQTIRRERKKQLKRHRQTDEGRTEHHSSPSEFMEYVRKRLKDEGFSNALMETIFREAHQFSDAKLTRKNRNRMHRFLCKLKEKLESSSLNQQKRILRDGKRAFKQMKDTNF